MAEKTFQRGGKSAIKLVYNNTRGNRLLSLGPPPFFAMLLLLSMLYTYLVFLVTNIFSIPTCPPLLFTCTSTRT
jgi:hypothetical protein